MENKNRFENISHKQRSSMGIIQRSLINVQCASIEKVLLLFSIGNLFFFFFLIRIYSNSEYIHIVYLGVIKKYNCLVLFKKTEIS